MGSGEEWANDAPKRGWSCPIALAGIASSVLLVVFAAYVVVSDLVIG